MNRYRDIFDNSPEMRAFRSRDYTNDEAGRFEELLSRKYGIQSGRFQRSSSKKKETTVSDER